ncbi:MAG: hypothetical protein HYS26_02395 [Candidatus Kaiserbacteria bacterium]|nr:MAG: hypothetical protein HYS26_02395 [Candidatus Kaiserbacteria bacterium]
MQKSIVAGMASAFVIMILMTAFGDPRSKTREIAQDMSAGIPFAEQRQRLGIAVFTGAEAVYDIGIRSLLSPEITTRGTIRRLGFRDESGGHHEAIVACLKPRITERTAHIYARVNRFTGRPTFYVACELDLSRASESSPGRVFMNARDSRSDTSNHSTRAPLRASFS